MFYIANKIHTIKTMSNKYFVLLMLVCFQTYNNLSSFKGNMILIKIII